MNIVILLIGFFSVVSVSGEGLNTCVFIANCSDADEFSEKECYDCVNQYEMLESYILGNDALLSTLSKVFYKTDDDPAEFVKINYHYQILNDSKDISDYCFDMKRIYFWSTSPSYLLGPEPMFWLSLFAINPSVSSVSIQLPCLQKDTVRDLLSRLTYLVSYNDNESIIATS